MNSCNFRDFACGPTIQRFYKSQGFMSVEYFPRISHLNDTVASERIFLGSFESLVLKARPALSEERRELIKTIIKSANIILVGLLMYKLWNNKWTKLTFNKSGTGF